MKIGIFHFARKFATSYMLVLTKFSSVFRTKVRVRIAKVTENVSYLFNSSSNQKTQFSSYNKKSHLVIDEEYRKCTKRPAVPFSGLLLSSNQEWQRERENGLITLTIPASDGLMQADIMIKAQ